MTLIGWVMMAVICSFVWGGFAALLLRAMRAEARKERGPGPAP